MRHFKDANRDLALEFPRKICYVRKSYRLIHYKYLYTQTGTVIYMEVTDFYVFYGICDSIVYIFQQRCDLFAQTFI